MASNLSRRVRRIENSISLLGMLYDRLRYLQPPMLGLIAALAGLEQFAGTVYLQRCRGAMSEGQPFPAAWRQGVEADRDAVGAGHAQVLLPLGEVLGSVDLESQLTALRHAVSMLESELEQAREHREKYGRLYRSMGVLCGLAVAIVFI